jgi:hypothetical protein
VLLNLLAHVNRRIKEDKLNLLFRRKKEVKLILLYPPVFIPLTSFFTS